MKILLFIIAAIVFMVLFLCYLFLRRTPEHSNVSIKNLQRYISYLKVALENGGLIQIIPSGIEGHINLRKKEYKTKPDVFLVELSSGFHSREKLVDISNVFIDKDIEHKLTFTKKKGLPKRLVIRTQTNEMLTSVATTNIIRCICNEINEIKENSFTLKLYGPFKIGYTPEDGEVIEHLSSYKFGWFVGYLIGSIRKK